MKDCLIGLTAPKASSPATLEADTTKLDCLAQLQARKNVQCLESTPWNQSYPSMDETNRESAELWLSGLATRTRCLPFSPVAWEDKPRGLSFDPQTIKLDSFSKPPYAESLWKCQEQGGARNQAFVFMCFAVAPRSTAVLVQKACKNIQAWPKHSPLISLSFPKPQAPPVFCNTRKKKPEEQMYLLPVSGI